MKLQVAEDSGPRGVTQPLRPRISRAVARTPSVCVSIAASRSSTAGSTAAAAPPHPPPSALRPQCRTLGPACS
eukprot:1148540-Pleurochrysis_carterae.AAC.1